MSRTLIKTFEAGQFPGKLVLEVHSWIQHIGADAVIPFWNTLKMTDMIGTFQLNLTHKVTGVDAMFPAVTKIGASDNIRKTVRIKTQNNPGACFEGNLFQLGTSLSTAHIREKLVEKAGSSWFNPQHPDIKKMPPSMEQKPLVHVGDEIEPSTDVSLRMAGRAGGPNAKGLSKDPLQIGLLLQEFAEKSDGGIIASDKIAEIVAGYVFSASGDRPKRGYGNMIKVWVEAGFLERAGTAKKAVPYKITQKAVHQYGIVVPAPKLINIQQAAEIGYAQLVTILDPGILEGLLGEATAKAKMLIDARTKINELDKQRKALAEEIKLLKYTAKDPLLNASLKLVSQMPKFK